MPTDDKWQLFLANSRPYSCGHSAALKDFLEKMRGLADKNKPVFIYGEQGCGKGAFAKALGSLRQTGFAELDLDNYTGAERETQIWTALKDILKVSSTLYVRGLNSDDILFLISILEWLAGAGASTLVALETRELLGSIPPEFFAKYELLTIPPLRERKEDIPLIVDAVLTDLETRYGTRLKHLETLVWDDFLRRNWSGNIDELRYNLEAVIIDLPPEQEVLRLADLIKSAD